MANNLYTSPYTILIGILTTKPAYDVDRMREDATIFSTPTTPDVKAFIEFIKNDSTISYYSYYKAYELLENISMNISKSYSIPSEFYILQSKEKIQKWLNELNNIYGKDNETRARNIRNQLITSIYNELTECLQKQIPTTPVATQQYEFDKKFMDIPDIFNPFIAGFDPVKLNLIVNANAGFKIRCVDVKKEYVKKHTDYLSKQLSEFEILKIKASDDYIGTKRIKDNVNELAVLIRADIQKLYNIKNVYDEKEKKDIISKFNEFLKVIDEKLKNLVEKERFFKDKSDNKNVKKKHEFSMDIKLNTNVLDHQVLTYAPNMTVQSIPSTPILFTPLTKIQSNTALSNLSDNPEHIYTQFINKNEFTSLMNRVNRYYILGESKDEYEYEYSFVNKKKEDGQTIDNISVILDIFFKKNNPFYVEGKRYSVFTYDWDNKISSIKKNGREELYNGDSTTTTPIMPIMPITTPLMVLVNPLTNLIGRINNATTATGNNLANLPNQLTNLINDINAKNTNPPTTINDVIKCLQDVNFNSPYKRVDNIKTTLETIEENSTPETARKVGQLIPIIDALFTSSKETLFIWERMDLLYTKFNGMINVPDILDIPDIDKLYKISSEYHYLKKKACAQNVVDNSKDKDEDKKFNHLWQWCDNPKYNSWDSLQSISKSCENANATFNNIQNFLIDPLDHDHDEMYDTIDEYHIHRNIADASGFSIINQPTSYYDFKKMVCNDKNTNITPLYKSYNEIMTLVETDKYLDNMTEFRKKMDEYKKLSPTVVKSIDSSFVSAKVSSLLNTFDNWFGRGGASIYVDVGVDDSMHYQKEEKREQYATRMQEEEMKSSTTVVPADKDAESITVKWDYGISISIYLYPGDKIPLSAYASLYCSIKKDNIYNLFNHIKGGPKKDSEKNKTIKKTPLGIYTPVSPVSQQPNSKSTNPQPQTNPQSQPNKTQKNKQN